MSLQTIHCETCQGTGRLWEDDYFTSVCLSCEGAGFIQGTADQIAEKTRLAKASFQEAFERSEIERQESKRKRRQVVLLIAVLFLGLLGYWFSQFKPVN